MQSFAVVLQLVLLCTRQLVSTGMVCPSSEKGVPEMDDRQGNKTCMKLAPRNYILPRIDPVEVGDVTTMQLQPNRLHRRVTLAKHPPLFEIADFLSPEESDHIVKLSGSSGLQVAEMLGNKGSYENQNQSKIGTRRGFMTFIRADSDSVLRKILHRIQALTQVPFELLEESEVFQVGLYGVGGHYHAHYDSSPVSQEKLEESICCHQTELPHSGNKCVVCRYITVLLYLNDVEEGGETAFPIADTNVTDVSDEHLDLSHNCHRSSVVIKPAKGKAVMWYNNFRHPQTGWIGTYDLHSLHGGCDVIRGEKWISNVWISAAQYHRRFDRSIYTERWV